MGRIAFVLLIAGCSAPISAPISSSESQTIAAGSAPGGRAYSSIAAGASHSCALGRNGAVYCGGSNSNGQLGDGTITDRHVPVTVSGLTNQVFVAAGNTSTCSVGADGSLHCWGINTNGALGNGVSGGPNAGGYDTPQQVKGTGLLGSFNLSEIVEVAVGGLHACARDYSGSVWCWGNNAQGQLGNGTTTSSSYAKFVSSVTAIGLAAGLDHTCALLANHTVACWGLNNEGQLGNGTTSNSSTPVVIAGLTNVTSISGEADGACALIADGTVKCWGENFYSELGNGTAGGAQLTPTYVRNPGNTANLTGVASISRSGGGGGYARCAVLASGAAYCWGSNDAGQTGSGTVSTRQSLPVALGATGGVAPAEIVMGEEHGCARTVDGNLWCWGDNSFGQLGDNSTVGSDVPVYNDIPQWVSPAQRLAAITDGACAITSAHGQVYCWSATNSFGQVGDGTTTVRNSPVLVSGGLQNVVGLARRRSRPPSPCAATERSGPGA